MTPLQRSAFLAHARLPAFSRQVLRAERIVRDGLAATTAPYVACSFGKDSAVMLHLVMQQYPSVPVRFVRWPETGLLNDFEPVLAAWESRFGLVAGQNLHFCDLSRPSIEVVVPGRHRAVAALAPTDGYFIGLRAEESKGRRMALKKFGPVHHAASGLWRIAPLDWWRWQDVAAYTALHELPVLASYGSTGLEGRTATRVGIPEHGIRQSQLSELRLRDPDAYNRLCSLLLEVLECL